MPQVDEVIPRLSPPGPSCKLESLNSDVLTLILSSCDSSHDLWSFIRASPIIYNVFHNDKAGILCRMNFYILGGLSATRKAIFLTHCDPVSHDGDFQSNLEGVIYLYQNFQPRTHTHTGVPVANDLGWDTIVQITRLTSVFCCFADLYALFRLRFIGKRMMHQPYGQNKLAASAVAAPLTQSERSRLITALLNWKLVHTLQGQHQPRDLELFIATIFPLFEAWEWEQITSLDSFIWKLIGNLFEVAEPELRPAHDSWSRSYRSTAFYSTCYPNLDVFYSKLLSSIREEEKSGTEHIFGVLNKIGDDYAIELASGRAHFRNGLSWLSGTNSWRRLISDHYLPLRELVDDEGVWNLDNVPAISGTSLNSPPPPWAWLHAMGGKRINRWGSSLVPKVGAGFDIDRQEHREWVDVVGLWRWIGMVFWDRDRAEEILSLFEETGDLVGCGKMGWLADMIIFYTNITAIP
ncbi:hypothetical protein QBC37DRAFT_433695 [Rhypophila decipiens]|uniref:Uncharacterized protein n=1 Tax=Rhypophila decipiens TaxID=261697 RepID=A0AAN7B2A4_9PEZI|nr:hypothetical protein QBC37DRAFT_433695 [Rhypophila decipiens]